MGIVRGTRVAAAAAVSAVLVAAACGGEEPDARKSTGTLTVNTSFVVKTLDPGQVYEPTGSVVVHALYDTLVTFKGSTVGKPVPSLAQSYIAAADGRTFNFLLRKNAKFPDGTPVTAQDVVFSLNRLKNLKGSAAPIVKDLTFIARDKVAVKVVSKTVNPNVPAILAQPYAGILNAKQARAHGGTDAANAPSADKLTTYLNTHPLGSGPYGVDSFDAASRIVLKRNDKYWGSAPKFGRVVFQNMDVQNQKLTMAKQPSSQVALDLAGNALDGLPAALKQTGSPSTYYQLRIHADPKISKVTSNRNWVLALQAAMDYQGIAGLFGKSGAAAAGIVPTAYAGALPRSEAQKQDLTKAKSLLKQSGVGSQQVKLLYPAITFVGVDLGTVAAKIQSDAKKAGIKIELDPAPIASFLDQRKTNKVPFSLSPQLLDYPVAASIVADLMPGGHTAEAAGWTTQNADPATVAAGKKVLAATDPTEQDSALQAWQRLMIKNSPYVTLVYSSASVVASANLTGAAFTPAGWTVDVAEIGTR